LQRVPPIPKAGSRRPIATPPAVSPPRTTRPG
jgi:hypothetical protein